MAIRNIVKDEEFLRKKSREINVFDDRLFTLLDDMKETLESEQGVGLAAVQVGVLRRAVIIDIGEGVIELINPVITYSSDETINETEGCLSFPGQYGYVERPAKIKAQYQDRNGDIKEIEGENLLARALCHEIDHTNGIVYKDFVTEYIDADDE